MDEEIKDIFDGKITYINKCRAKCDCPRHCKVELTAFIDNVKGYEGQPIVACASLEKCAFQIKKTIYVEHLPK